MLGIPLGIHFRMDLGEPNGAETPVFTGFQAQKKTSVDVFR
jgi:hypothetical protein